MSWSYSGTVRGSGYALRVLVGSALCWAVIAALGLRDPLWALISVIMVTEPDLEAAIRRARERVNNTLAGAIVGLVCLLAFGSSPWVLFLGLAVVIVLGVNTAGEPERFRLAQITVVLVLGSGALSHSQNAGVYTALKRSGEVLLGCCVPLLLTFATSWWLPRTRKEPATAMAKLPTGATRVHLAQSARPAGGPVR